MFDSLLTSPTPSVPELPYYTRNKVSQRGFNSMKLRQTRGFSSYKLRDNSFTNIIWDKNEQKPKHSTKNWFKSVLNFPPPLLISAPKIKHSSLTKIKFQRVLKNSELSGKRPWNSFFKTCCTPWNSKHILLILLYHQWNEILCTFQNRWGKNTTERWRILFGLTNSWMPSWCLVSESVSTV